MWVKLENKELLRNLKLGDWIVKYPICNQEPLENYKMANADNTSVRMVYENTQKSEDLQVTVANFILTAEWRERSTLFAPSHKNYDEIIDDKSWWVFNEV